jgi:hypothetical protein
MVAEVLSIPRRPRVEFDDIPAGPDLTGALDEVDMAALVGEDVAAGARAAARAANHADWQRLCYLYEMCRARAGTLTRSEEPDAAVAAAAFGWSMAMATAELTLAVGALERLPALGEALQEGWLEQRKAAVFVTVLADLDDTQATTVVGDLLPEAPALPIQQLTHRVIEAAIAVDGQFAARRYAAARQRARLRTSISPAGTVGLSVHDADPDLAQDAYLHVQTLARAVRARLRRRGRRVRLGYIACHTLLRLSGITLLGADDDTVIATITDELDTDPDTPPQDTDPDDTDPDDGPDDDGPSDSGPSDSGPDTGGPDDLGPDDSGPDDSGPDDSGPADGGPGHDAPDTGPDDAGSDNAGSDKAGSDNTGPDDAGSDNAGSDNAGSDNAGSDNAGSDNAGSDNAGCDDAGTDTGHDDTRSGSPSTGRAGQVPLLAGVSVRLPLATLLGLEDRPGRLPGLGPLPGHVAARLARHRRGARTRLLLHDPAGRLEYLLDLGPPPAATTNPRRRQIIEITAETELVDGLDPADFDTGRAELLRRARAALDALRAHPEAHPAVSLTDRDRRFPGPALAAWVRARDQHCPFRACPRPAHDNDLDHTLAWTQHGTTVARNLSPPCRAHHTRKHRDWQLRQPAPGRFVITDPTGTEHHTTSRVVDPLPDPCPPTEEEPHRLPLEALLPLPDEQPEPWRPRRTRDHRITPQARDTLAHLTDRARRHRGDPPTRYDDDPDF